MLISFDFLFKNWNCDTPSYKCEKIWNIKTQQKCLLLEIMTRFLQDNPQTLLWAEQEGIIFHFIEPPRTGHESTFFSAW